MLDCYKQKKEMAMTKQAKFDNGQRSKTAYQSQEKIQVKLGQLYRATDEHGNIVWCIEQKPIIKG